MTRETGRDWAEHTADHVLWNGMDFDVWAYARPLGGFTVGLRQLPPQEMLEATGSVLTAPVALCTLTCAGGLTTHLDGLTLEPDAERLAWEDLPDDIKSEVVGAASVGWVWNGVEHHYDLLQGWVPVVETAP